MSGTVQFNPERSAAIRQMLVRDAGLDVRRPRAHRQIALFVALVVGAVLVAGGSTAWALGFRPITFGPPVPVHSHSSTPTATPTPTPTPTTSAGPTANFLPPVSSMPFDCAALGNTPALTALLGKSELADLDSPDLLSNQSAALRDAGVVSCLWSSKYGFVTVDVSNDVASGRTDIAKQLGTGSTSLHIGAASAAACNVTVVGCAASVVAGHYWFNLNLESQVRTHTTLPPNEIGVIKHIAAVLQTEPASTPSWVMPRTSWSPVGDCSSLATATPMSTLLGQPGFSGVEVVGGQSEGAQGIVRTQQNMWSCGWTAQIAPTIPFDRIGVMVVPGARWAYEQAAADSVAKPAAVSGADSAVMRCWFGDGNTCVLDVLTDNSWMTVSGGASDFAVTGTQDKLILVAEQVLAAHAKNG